MAWDALKNPAILPLCSAGSDVLPIGGMPEMYLLMSVFHLPPWLKIRARGALLTINEGDRQ
jgi:hypothetical protein